MANKKVGHPKKVKKQKRPPALKIEETLITEDMWKSWIVNSLRREAIILRKAAVKTAATKDELLNLMRKDAFLIAAAKSLGIWEPDHEEFVLREGYEQYFVPPEKKASDLKIWDERNTPPKNPLNPSKSIYVYVTNEAKASYIACFEYESGLWKNRENKRCNNIVDWSIVPKETEE